MITIIIIILLLFEKVLHLLLHLSFGDDVEASLLVFWSPLLGTFLWLFLLPLCVNLCAEMYFPRVHTKQMHTFYYHINGKSNGILDTFPPTHSQFRDVQPSTTAGEPPNGAIVFSLY